MRQRADRLRRVVKAQEQLTLAEEWKLRALERRLIETEQAERDLIASLNEETALQGLFLDAAARRLRSLAEAGARLREEIALQSRRLLACSGKLKAAQRLSAEADAEVRRKNEQTLLADVIEHSVALSPASLP